MKKRGRHPSLTKSPPNDKIFFKIISLAPEKFGKNKNFHEENVF